MNKQIDDSTALIIGSIEKQARAELEKLRALSEQLYAEKAAALEAEIKNKYESRVRCEAEKQRAAADRKAADLDSHNKAALAALREKVMDEVFAAARASVLRFTESEAYADFLAGSLASMRGLYEGEAEIRIRPCDEPYQERLAAAFGGKATFNHDDSIVLGGVKVYFKKAAVIADDTLDARLAAQRKDFVKNSGLGIGR